MDAIKAQIKQFIVNEFLPGEAEANLQDDFPLQTGGILDSLGLLRVITFVEASFNIEVGPLEAGANNFSTVERIAAFVRSKVQSLYGDVYANAENTTPFSIVS